MKIIVSSDEYSPLIDHIIEDVRKRGHKVRYFGPGSEEKGIDWPVVTQEAVEEVSEGQADEAIILCWTGTGCTIVANKMAGIRASLCVDAETARGARKWNHANVLALSLRTTSLGILHEILNAWFDTPYTTDEWNIRQIERVNKLDSR